METDLKRIDDRDESLISGRKKLKDVPVDGIEEGSHPEHKVTRNQEDPDPCDSE